MTTLDAVELSRLRANTEKGFRPTKAEALALINALETARGEAERQYEENVSQIAKYAALETENERLREELDEFVRWAGAYPTDIFPEPDYARAHELLQAGGMTLDVISASIMRRTVENVGKRARAALLPVEQK